MDDQLTTMAPDFRAMTDPEHDEWARAEARAAVQDEIGYIGVDYHRMLHRGYPREGVLGDWTLDTWPATTPARSEALRLARLFADDHASFERETGRAGLALAGDTGRGKTGLAVGIGWILTGRGFAYSTFESLFVTWRDLMRQCYDAVGGGGLAGGALATSAGVGAIIRRYAEVEVLVLDDLGDPGAERGTPFARQVLAELVWPRYDRALPTVITTNCAADDLQRLFGDAATSRLYGMAKWAVIDGADERMRGAA